MNIDNVPKEVLEWIMEDVRDNVDVESNFYTSAYIYLSKFPDYFVIIKNVIWKDRMIGHAYTDKAKILYYFLKL